VGVFGWILLVVVLIAAMAMFTRWSYDDGLRDGYDAGEKAGYAKGRQEIDRWWIEMDQQLDEEWLKIWHEER
jgi:hypothetical protein